MKEITYGVIRTEIGDILAGADGEGVRSVKFMDVLPEDTKNYGGGHNRHLADCLDQLKEYFDGQRREFNLELKPEGTDFQKAVWEELLKIPYGKMVPYGYIAREIGNPLAARAVGRANSQNPIAVIIPCHRVIGASGDLTGYASGIERKRYLLKLEGGFSR